MATLALQAQPKIESILPAAAVVIERTPIPAAIHADREMILWMISPMKHDRFKPSGIEGYSCPEWTQGYYYSGPTRISLVDTLTKRLINTVKLRFRYGKEDSFDVPFRIIGDLFYTVPGHDKSSEGTPALLGLSDINGDGLPLETAFFEAEACMGLQTTLFGYSPKQDRVIQYEVELTAQGNKIVEGRGIVKAGKATVEKSAWVDYLFSRKPDHPGHWTYKIDYTGRGGSLDEYDVHYDPIRETFLGTVTRTILPWGDQ